MYNPLKTIKAFNMKNNANLTTEVQYQPLKNFITTTPEDIEATLPSLKQKWGDNLTKHERIVLKKFSNNDQIIINKTDKGTTVVLQNTTDYVTEGLQHLGCGCVVSSSATSSTPSSSVSSSAPWG